MDASQAMQELYRRGVEFKIEALRGVGIRTTVNRAGRFKQATEMHETVGESVDWILEKSGQRHKINLMED